MTDSTASQAVVIERTFEAPAELIWRLWTVPEEFKRWYGPTGANVPVAEINLEVGGQRLVCMEMETPQGKMSMWTVGEHLEIVPNERLIYTEAPSDENGTPQEPRPGQPGKTKVIIELEERGDSTIMVLRHEGIPADSPGKMGWEQAFAKLEDFLNSLT